MHSEIGTTRRVKPVIKLQKSVPENDGGLIPLEPKRLYSWKSLNSEDYVEVLMGMTRVR